jgi:hypothetical protein
MRQTDLTLEFEFMAYLDFDTGYVSKLYRCESLLIVPILFVLKPTAKADMMSGVSMAKGL